MAKSYFTLDILSHYQRESNQDQIQEGHPHSELTGDRPRCPFCGHRFEQFYYTFCKVRDRKKGGVFVREGVEGGMEALREVFESGQGMDQRLWERWSVESSEGRIKASTVSACAVIVRIVCSSPLLNSDSSSLVVYCAFVCVCVTVYSLMMFP